MQTSSFTSIGFGCYRIDINIKEHGDALRHALLSGINLIDTSANYSDGRSEMLVGKVLDELISDGKINRGNITLVTKAGYLQGSNLRNAIQLKNEGKGFAEVVEFSERLCHSINPGFLEDQLNRQLERLGQNYIDVYLLHNPEYYLGKAREEKMNINDAREIYYDRIRRAFEFLEKKVSEGVILAYGVSSNTFPEHSDHYEFTSLEMLIDIANSVSRNNHFGFIQLPFNLFEAGALKIKNQINNTETVLELASRAGIKVLVNRPLNAIASQGLVRLSDFKADDFLEKDFIKQMKLVQLMEDDLVSEKLPDEITDKSKMESVVKLLSLGKTIEKDWKFFGSIEHFNDMVEHFFAPRISRLMDFFENKIKNENTYDFFKRYLKECYLLLNFVSNYYKLKAAKRNAFIAKLLNEKLDPEFQDLTLSQKAILLLRSIQGVSCVLTGMRKEKYVDDILPALNSAKIENADEVIRYVSSEVEDAGK